MFDIDLAVIVPLLAESFFWFKDDLQEIFFVELFFFDFSTV